MPLFTDKKIDNGSLKIAIKSHFNENYPYKKYIDKKIRKKCVNTIVGIKKIY